MREHGALTSEAARGAEEISTLFFRLFRDVAGSHRRIRVVSRVAPRSYGEQLEPLTSNDVEKTNCYAVVSTGTFGISPGPQIQIRFAIRFARRGAGRSTQTQVQPERHTNNRACVIAVATNNTRARHDVRAESPRDLRRPGQCRRRRTKVSRRRRAASPGAGRRAPRRQSLAGQVERRRARERLRRAHHEARVGAASRPPPGSPRGARGRVRRRRRKQKGGKHRRHRARRRELRVRGPQAGASRRMAPTPVSSRPLKNRYESPRTVAPPRRPHPPTALIHRPP